MRIKDVRPGGGPSRRGFVCLGRFNLEPTDGVVLYDLSLERAPNGRLFLYSPMKSGGPVANFSPAVRGRVIALVEDVLEDANDRAAAA